jgi:hypothetical protein
MLIFFCGSDKNNKLSLKPLFPINPKRCSLISVNMVHVNNYQFQQKNEIDKKKKEKVGTRLWDLENQHDV